MSSTAAEGVRRAHPGGARRGAEEERPHPRERVDHLALDGAGEGPRPDDVFDAEGLRAITESVQSRTARRRTRSSARRRTRSTRRTSTARMRQLELEQQQKQAEADQTRRVQEYAAACSSRRDREGGLHPGAGARARRVREAAAVEKLAHRSGAGRSPSRWPRSMPAEREAQIARRRPQHAAEIAKQREIEAAEIEKSEGARDGRDRSAEGDRGRHHRRRSRPSRRRGSRSSSPSPAARKPRRTRPRPKRWPSRKRSGPSSRS
jgi:hypothetical protein